MGLGGAGISKHRFGCLQVKAAGKDRQAAEQVPLRVGQ